MYCNQLRHRPGHFQAHSAPSEQLRMREGSAVGGGGARAQGGKRGRQQRESVGEQGAARGRGAPGANAGGAGRERPGTPAKNGSGKVQAVQGSGTPAKESKRTFAAAAPRMHTPKRKRHRFPVVPHGGTNWTAHR